MGKENSECVTGCVGRGGKVKLTVQNASVTQALPHHQQSWNN